MRLRGHAEALYQALRSLLKTHDVELVHALLERELRDIVPDWTEAKPSCPGWYWLKPSGVGEPRLILVDNGRIDTKLMADLGPPHNLVDVQRVQGQWAGPLLPPT